MGSRPFAAAEAEQEKLALCERKKPDGFKEVASLPSGFIVESEHNFLAWADPGKPAQHFIVMPDNLSCRHIFMAPRTVRIRG